MAKTVNKNYEADRVYDGFRSEFDIAPTDFTTLEDFLEDVTDKIDSAGHPLANFGSDGVDKLLDEARSHWESESEFEARVVEGETELVDRAATETAVDRAMRGEGAPRRRAPRVTPSRRGVSRRPSARARVVAPRTRARVVVPAEARAPTVTETPGGRISRVVQQVSSGIDESSSGRRARAIVSDVVSRLRKRLGR